MKGSKKLGCCLIFLHVILCLTSASLCGVCIFIAVTTYDFRSLITEELWNNVIGLGSLGAFTVLTGFLGCVAVTFYEKKITILFDVFLFVTIIGMIGTGIFFHLESSEISESDFNTTIVERPDIGNEVSNKLDCSQSMSDTDYCAGVLYDYFNIFHYVIIGLIVFLLLLQIVELLLSIMYRKSILSHQDNRITPVHSSEMYGNWWAESGTGGEHYYRHNRQPNPQHY